MFSKKKLKMGKKRIPILSIEQQKELEHNHRNSTSHELRK